MPGFARSSTQVWRGSAYVWPADSVEAPIPSLAGGGRVFCLVEAPSAEAAAGVHREAHGLVADHIYRVQEGS